ncbi:MAG: hypothetical protein REI93_11410, partial [Pedobacter sp.]|nr:hypothetical protein [Pedobacter sp.]
MKKIILIILLLAIVQIGHAQLPNVDLFNRIRPADSLNKELHFNLYNFNYVRNYEYSNKFHDGYTLYGTQLMPQLVY